MNILLAIDFSDVLDGSVQNKIQEDLLHISTAGFGDAFGRIGPVLSQGWLEVAACAPAL
jgi:hypothetical protein